MHEVSIRRFPKYLSVLLNTTTRSRKKNSKLRKAIRNLTYLNPTKRKNSKLRWLFSQSPFVIGLEAQRAPLPPHGWWYPTTHAVVYTTVVHHIHFIR